MPLKKKPVRTVESEKVEEVTSAAEEEVTSAAEEEVEQEEAAAPADKSESKEVATSGPTAMAKVGAGKFEDQMAEEGFGGLEVGFYSYTTIKLAPEGHFETAEGTELGKSLKVQLMESKGKWAYTRSDDDDVAEFSYDRIHNTKGDLLDPILEEWRAEDAKVNEKKYLDVTAMVLEGDLEGEIVILSVSPSGVAKFTGYMGKLTYKGLNPKDTVTDVHVGPKVTGVKKPFYPWAFKVAS